MADIKELLSLLAELDDQLVSCMRCGMCQAVCPLYAVTGREAHVARGKIALLDGLAKKLITDAKGVQERLDDCLLCGSCAANCPSGVSALTIFLKGRAVLTAYLGLSPAKKAVFRGLLKNPRLFNALTGLASKFQGVFTKPLDDMLGASCARFALPGLGDRHLLPLAETPLRARTGTLRLPAGASGLTAAFFPGCVTDKVFPHTGQAALRVFRHHGVGVFMPEVQACCGIPALSAGDLSTFESLVMQNLEIFTGHDVPAFDYLVTPCATCASTIKKLWPEMTSGLPGQARARVKALAAKTMDVTAFLVDTLGLTPPEKRGPGSITVTCHDPCHLRKSLGVSAQPRALARMHPEVEIVEMAAPDACCGCGGSFNLRRYGMSKAIGMKKRDSVAATGASVVAAGCPACMMQISDMLSQAGDRVAVKHPVELYAQYLETQGG